MEELILEFLLEESLEEIREIIFGGIPGRNLSRKLWRISPEELLDEIPRKKISE